MAEIPEQRALRRDMQDSQRRAGFVETPSQAIRHDLTLKSPTGFMPCRDDLACRRCTCDLYVSGRTPRDAAHSTTRALCSAYNRRLYQVSRGSDSAAKDITPLFSGGVANAAAQDSFCANTTCLITIMCGQYSQGNHLIQAPPGGAATSPPSNGYDKPR